LTPNLPKQAEARMKLILRHLRRTSHNIATACALFSVLAYAASGCQTSFTPKPHCSAGWHVEHAPSHQGHVWDCVADYGPGRVPS
jgi:hypothetical protein